MTVILGEGDHRYRVVEDWAKLPEASWSPGLAAQTVSVLSLAGSCRRMSSRSTRVATSTLAECRTRAGRVLMMTSQCRVT